MENLFLINITNIGSLATWALLFFYDFLLYTRCTHHIRFLRKQNFFFSLWGFTGWVSITHERNFPLRNVCQDFNLPWLPRPFAAAGASPECRRQTSLSDDALLYSDILIYHSLRGGSSPLIHTLLHTHAWAVTVPSPRFLMPAHTPTGWGGTQSQESCGLINYHVKKTKVGPPEVTAFLSNCFKAVSWRVKNF